MKKSTKIYIASLTFLMIMFVFAFSSAQSAKIDLKTAYEDFSRIDSILESGENLDEAKKIINEAEKVFIEDPNIYLKKAQIYMETKEYDVAEESINKIFELRPDLENNAEVLKIYANIVFLKGDHKRAQEITNKLNSLGNS